MPVHMSFDPFQLLIEIFNEQHPDKDCRIMWTDTIDDGGLGVTWFPNEPGKTPEIALDANTPVYGCIEILAHELAHVAAGPDVDEAHGAEWENAFEAIFQAYCKRVEELTAQTGGCQALLEHTRPAGPPNVNTN